ncbi:MAG: Tetratricopeptide 4 [Frankiales bacterium]|nr:Tetratricopeptide 4 [Frankiales bacterium]
MPLPDDVAPEMLDQEVRRSLLTLSHETAELVARHLVMTGRLLDEDPEQALVHARAAGALAGRVAVVREAVGLAAYTAGEWAEALSELRAHRRMSGSPEHLPVLADCERALGRPERARTALDDADVPRLEQATRVELVIVVAGARRDLGQPDAAVLLLQGPARATTGKRPWAARLWYAYADALLDAGRDDEAREWFEKASDVDADGETDAADRLLALDGVLFDHDADDEDEQPEGEEQALDAEGLRALVADAVELERDGGHQTNPSAPVGQASTVQESGLEVPGAELSDVEPPAAPPGKGAGEERHGPGEPTPTSPFSDRLEAQPRATRPAAVPSVTFVPAESEQGSDED